MVNLISMLYFLSAFSFLSVVPVIKGMFAFSLSLSFYRLSLFFLQLVGLSAQLLILKYACLASAIPNTRITH